MKRNILILLVSLLIPILSFSQTTYPKITKDSLIVLTPLQLKKTNLIFVEHSKLKEENLLLREVILLKDSTINVMHQSENLRFNQLSDLKSTTEKQQSQIEELNKALTKKTKAYKRARDWAIGGCTVSLGLILLFVL